jgi:hypothetical protein
VEGSTEGGVEGSTMSMYPGDKSWLGGFAGWNELPLLGSMDWEEGRGWGRE